MRGVGGTIGIFAVVIVCVGCAVIDGSSGQGGDPLKDDPELAFVRSVMAWLRREIADAGTRRFDFSPTDFDYRGGDVALRTLASSIRDDVARFQPAQNLVRDILREPLLAQIVDQIPVQVVSDEELSALGHGDLNGAFYDGKLYLRRKAIARGAADGRPPHVLVVHELLHALGFPNDPEPAVLGAAMSGRMAVPGFTLPPELVSLTSGDVINRASAILVLLSEKYRGAQGGDDPASPVTYTWTTVSDHSFGGAGPNGNSLADAPMPGWVQPEGRPFKQFDGFHVTPEPPFTDIDSFIGIPKIKTTATPRHFRLFADFAATTGRTFDVYIYHGARMFWFRRTGLQLYSLVMDGAVCNNTQASFFGNQEHPFRLGVEIVSAGPQRTVRVNGEQICSSTSGTQIDAEVTVSAINARLDRLRLDFGTEASP